MSFNLIDIVEYVLNIVVLCILLRVLVYTPVRSYMKKREETFTKSREEIKTEQENVEKLKRQYDASLESARAEAERTVREGVERADRAAKEIIEKAEQEARTTLVLAREQAERERRETTNSLKSEITGLAVGLATKIMEREISIDDNRQIIDKFFGEAS